MKWKVAIGIVLIVASVAGMYLWETRFRDEITMEERLVAARDIDTYEVVKEEDFKSIHVNAESVASQSLSKEDLPLIVGKLAAVPIYMNQQVNANSFVVKEDLTPEGFRHFAISSEWIYSMSETLRENEKVKIYGLPEKDDDLTVDRSGMASIEECPWFEQPEKNYFGTFKLALLLPETDVEILARIEDYLKMYDAVHFHQMRLILVAEDE